MADPTAGQIARRNARRLTPQTEAARVALADTDRARRSLERLSSSMDDVVDALKTAHQRKAHDALGYDSWDDYCAAEFASVRTTRIAISDRVEIVAALAAVGMPTPAIGSALGVSKATADRDRARGQQGATADAAMPRQNPAGRYTGHQTGRGTDPGAAAGRAVIAGTVLATSDRAPRRPTMPWPGQHFGTHHGLYGKAVDRCRGRGHQNPDAYGACGPCWEQTIRADVRAASADR